MVNQLSHGTFAAPGCWGRLGYRKLVVWRCGAHDKIFQMKDLRGKKIGLSKSLNTTKNDWWRIQEHVGIGNMLMLDDMIMKDVEIV